jgi:hypothetical protein
MSRRGAFGSGLPFLYKGSIIQGVSMSAANRLLVLYRPVTNPRLTERTARTFQADNRFVKGSGIGMNRLIREGPA